MASDRQPGTSSRGEPESWGDGGHWRKCSDTCNVHLFATDRGELRPSELYSTGQALSPINLDLISTLDATPPASGATPMIICMRGLMTAIRAAYCEATPLGLISREKKKQPNHT
ncbi:hypothetical protein FACUT_11806 [Fusarium acutatum]|uniref:Uncharacterized protein n=1 Tax=Fusarium acutatum TaxID=78861 RepID=A0A8H4JCN5_9HYPO|nr:hypothetical protein FACUT_11806 [Fusarium acutatum]